jgi:hypothetical protein
MGFKRLDERGIKIESRDGKCRVSQASGKLAAEITQPDKTIVHVL